MSNSPFVLPRPGASITSTTPIPAPSESAFVATFGAVLPAAQYLQTPHGRAAYYSLPPSSPTPTSSSSSTPITRVLFVHGVQTPAIGLQPLARALSSRFPHAHCVLIDLWGHGLSETPVLPHEPGLFHGLLLALLTHLDWSSAHLIGYSFGGSTVTSFAAKYPVLVSSLVLVAPAGLLSASQFSDEQRGYLAGGDAVVEAKARAWILEFLEGGRLVVPADWKERVSRGEVVAEAVREWQMKEHRGNEASVVGVFRDGGVLDRHAEFEEVVRRGEVRGLSVLGELDDVCSAGDLEAVGMRNVVVVKGVGHAVVRERVEEVAGLIEEFWKTL
ncbi:alpha/beta fold hydrolase [Aspergillus affinis]|uniref:alpha/beta fold hydrolase n=1 Tax=Aspergillus affinis TaxID=1070780 RepID=UPI0022FE0FDC|nr:Alpha/Beta hydrolase protein [Aspergillus affinis]KAI9042762.1 Alpha/Beta hydrolase protein [Aspergillus affinis]